ncbi:unnamed protein product [Alternaria alternata]
MAPKNQAPKPNRKRKRSKALDEPIEHSAKVYSPFDSVRPADRWPSISTMYSTIHRTAESLFASRGIAAMEPEAEVDTTPSTPQTHTRSNIRSDEPTNEPEEIYMTPPVTLPKISWAPRSAVPINRLGFITPKSEPSSSSKGTNWAEVLGQVSKLYSYQRISKDRVRLLLIKPGTFEEQINASLLVVSDDQLGSESFPYSALSYNWGNSEDDCTIVIQDDPASSPVKSIDEAVDVLRVVTQDKMMKIKPNLYEALRHLRKENQIVALWVDALCINQFDINEKEEQVLKMAQIYRKAYNVNVWLGSANPGDLVSNRAMAFIPKVINPDNHAALLANDAYIEDWASLYELLKWSWFSRRWVIQELAFAQSASVHCGKHVRDWSDFQTAIAIFHRHFDGLKARLMMHYESSQVKRSHQDDDSTLEIEHLGAKLLVDMTSTLFRKRPDGSLESTRGLENLVCSLSGFDTSDPRDTINAFRSISKEMNRYDQRVAGAHNPPPAPNYGKDLFEIYRDFVQWVVKTTGSLDIICRHWALKERKEPTPTTPRLVQLPSWILFVEDSAWGKGEDLFAAGRLAIALLGYPAATTTTPAVVIASTLLLSFPKAPYTTVPTASTQVTHDMSMRVKGVMIGTVSFRTDPFPDGVITRDCLEGLGWRFDKDAKEIDEVPRSVMANTCCGPRPIWKRTSSLVQGSMPTLS